MLTDLSKCPFPYFGGKRKAAPAVWAALGDVGHYVEPFAGSLAVLLCRPHEANRTYHSETVNDADGHLVNAWRAMQRYPQETAEWASWPVSECDLTARHLWLVRWREEGVARLCGDPDWCDPRAAGYWIWGMSCWIGGGWCSGTGPWTADDEGRIHKQPPAQKREPGVWAPRPHLHDDGQGVNRPQAREPGVKAQRPHLISNGGGVNRPQAREPGVCSECAEADPRWHPMTMPEIRRWFGWLSARLRHVRIICGDWKRAVTRSAAITLSCDAATPAGIFLDPPYAAAAGRDANLYATDSLTVADDVRAWCLEHGDDPLRRIVLAGFAGEGHEALVAAGWREVEWYAAGFLTGGYGQQGASGHQQAKERLWLSPHCLGAEGPRQMGLGL